MNKEIMSALEYANSKTNRNCLTNTLGVLKYWNDKEKVTWVALCEFASTIFGTFKPTKFTLNMLYFLIENNLYDDAFKDKLARDLPYLKECSENFKSCYTNIFNENYDELYFYRRFQLGKDIGINTKHIANANNYLGSLYLSFLSEEAVTTHYLSGEIIYIFLESVDCESIKDINDIDSSIFWTQVNFYKSYFKNNNESKKASIAFICKFYRWLATKYSNYNLFEDSTNITYELLFSSALVKNIINDAYFTSYTTSEDLSNKKRIVFILRNFNNKSTMHTKNSHFVLYLDKIATFEYRKLIIKYIQNLPSLVICSGQECHIIQALHFLETIKSKNNYPSPKLDSLNTAEAVMIRKFFKMDNPNLTLATLNNKIGSVRRFFLWCQKNNYLSFDSTFFDYLSQYEEPNKYYGKAIPDEDLVKISNKFIELCENDSTYKIYYAIFLILIETEFRPSQVCNLAVSSIQPTLKEDQFLIYSNTKTTNGKKITQPICLSTKKILDNIMENTEELRRETLQDSYKDHIFLRRASTIKNNIHGITCNEFKNKFQTICMLANTKKYNTRNLRDTHMTKAFEYIMRNGKSDLEMGLLSKHSHIDTTKSHYIETELTKMLESTYQVTLGSRDINQKYKIIDDEPKENKEVVENGCGYCNASSCHMTNSLPCLVCKDFVTTISHKPYFIKMIENCDVLLKKATIRHEIEDITLIKTLYINWLREICIKEETTEC